MIDKTHLLWQSKKYRHAGIVPGSRGWRPQPVLKDPDLDDLILIFPQVGLALSIPALFTDSSRCPDPPVMEKKQCMP